MITTSRSFVAYARRKASSAVLALCIMSLGIPSATAAPLERSSESPPLETLIEGDSIEVGGSEILPGGDGQEGEPAVVSDSDISPFAYRYERVCVVDGGNVSIACELARLQCDAGEGGMLVQWFRSPSALQPPVWEVHDTPSCIYSSDSPPAAETPTVSAEEFQRLPLAAATNIVQPVPHTLIGAHTNTYAVAEEQYFEEVILDYDVQIRATPIGYKWDFGDGVSSGLVATPGTALQAERWGEETSTSHVYGRTGDFFIVLTTHFNGEYSVDGGPWMPIPGQAVVPSEPVAISVWRSVTDNYADNCLENPRGVACQGAGR